MRPPLNFTIMRNPWNWVIVAVIVSFAGLALALLAPTPQPADKE